MKDRSLKGLGEIRSAPKLWAVFEMRSVDWPTPLSVRLGGLHGGSVIIINPGMNEFAQEWHYETTDLLKDPKDTIKLFSNYWYAWACLKDYRKHQGMVP